MPRRRDALAIVGVGIAAGVAGWMMASGQLAPTTSAPPSPLRLVDLDGKPRSLSEWDGRVRVINFWATWCAPCRIEIPELVASRDKLKPSGVEFIGIAIDQAAKVSEFVRTVRISYPVLLADAGGLALVREFGNSSGGLPFTVVLSAKGVVVQRNLGPVTQALIEDQVRGALLR